VYVLFGIVDIFRVIKNIMYYCIWLFIGCNGGWCFYVFVYCFIGVGNGSIE